MKQKIDCYGYDALLQLSDWRFSAAALGLLEYLDFCDSRYGKLDYKILSAMEKSEELPKEAIKGLDGILYHSSDITEERYLDFAEYWFRSEMTHCKIMDILHGDSLSDDDIKKVNDMVKSKKVLQNLFGKVKFDGKNSDEYIGIIQKNRYHIIKEIYRYSPMMYRGFNNTNLLLTQENPHCRLQGYNVDEGRKSKYVGYAFDKDTFVGNDCIEFDFIPFAFSNTHEGYFINNNFDLNTLKQTNRKFIQEINGTEEKNSRTKLYLALKNSADYIRYDVEVIIKPRDAEQYQTLFVRADGLKALQELPSNSIKFYYDDCNFNLENEVYKRCLNNELLDSCIEFMLKIRETENFKKKKKYKDITWQINNTIAINEKWKGENSMDCEMKDKNYIELAKSAAVKIKKHIVFALKAPNKLETYRYKILHAMIAEDYDNMNNIIISMCNYANYVPEFAMPLFENPAENIGIAQTFVANLIYNNTKENE